MKASSWGVVGVGQVIGVKGSVGDGIDGMGWAFPYEGAVGEGLTGMGLALHPRGPMTGIFVNSNHVSTPMGRRSRKCGCQIQGSGQEPDL